MVAERIFLHLSLRTVAAAAFARGIGTPPAPTTCTALPELAFRTEIVRFGITAFAEKMKTGFGSRLARRRVRDRATPRLFLRAIGRNQFIARRGSVAAFQVASLDILALPDLAIG